jgi:hypothetical protein
MNSLLHLRATLWWVIKTLADNVRGKDCWVEKFIVFVEGLKVATYLVSLATDLFALSKVSRCEIDTNARGLLCWIPLTPQNHASCFKGEHMLLINEAFTSYFFSFSYLAAEVFF